MLKILKKLLSFFKTDEFSSGSLIRTENVELLKILSLPPGSVVPYNPKKTVKNDK